MPESIKKKKAGLCVRNTISRLPVCLMVLLTFRAAAADPDLPYLDISRVRLADTLHNSVATAFAARDASLAQIFAGLPYRRGPIYDSSNIPDALVSKKLVARFNLCNSSDSTVSVCFSPGFYFTDIRLYGLGNQGLYPLPRVLPDHPDSIGYRLITLIPGDSLRVLAVLRPLKTYINNFRPRLINQLYVPAFIATVKQRQKPLELATYVFAGLMLMMIIFSLANFMQGSNHEFLYYSGYALFLGLMLFIKSYYLNDYNFMNFFQESYLDFVMQCTGHGFYIVFMREFLSTRTKYPFLYVLYNVVILLLAASVLSFSLAHFFDPGFVIQNTIESMTKIILLVMVVIFLVYAIRHWSDVLLRYLFWGNFALFGFSVVSLVIIELAPQLRLKSSLLANSLFYYEAGLVFELMLFLMGLSYKNRQQIIHQTRERERLKADNQMKEYEKELAVYKAQQEERIRISADMHDELGSGMTAIRLMSEIAKNKMKDKVPGEIEKISQSSNDLLNKMNAIIWSMNSGNDTVDNLVSYIRAYSLEYFDSVPPDCKVETPDTIPQIELSGDKRRNIFLCVKETLNNSVKHSHANLVRITISVNEHLVIDISDNGVGIDLENLRRFGNGLQNIKRRMRSIGGTYRIENDQGTRSVLELPLRQD